MPSAADQVATVAEQLYGLPAAEFTAARNAAAKEARSAGHRDLAARVAALPKPSTAAWVVNHLVRRHPDEVDALLELGADMRAAERARDPDRIRSLSRERNLRVPALARQARAAAESAGQPVSDAVQSEVESTLTAALATEDLAAAVRGGLLTRGLVWAGFGDLPEPAGLVAAPAPARRAEPAPAADRDEREHERLAAEAAKERAAERARERAEAEEAAAAAAERVAELTALVEDLTRQLASAEQRLTSAQEDARTAARRMADLSVNS